MSYTLFGAKTTLRTYATAEAALSVSPTLVAPTKAAVHAHLGTVLTAVETLTAVVVEVAADADARPVPPAPATLQELVAAGRARLIKERSRAELDRARAAVTHVTRLRELLAP